MGVEGGVPSSWSQYLRAQDERPRLLWVADESEVKLISRFPIVAKHLLESCPTFLKVCHDIYVSSFNTPYQHATKLAYQGPRKPHQERM